MAIRFLLPVCRPSPAQIKTHFSFRYLPEKRNGSWTPKRKGRFHAGFLLASVEPGPADVRAYFQNRVQSWNSLSPLFPRGDASLGAAWSRR